MKRAVLAGALGVFAIGGACAADLPARRAPPVYVPVPPVFSWTGFYAGANAGYAFDGNTSYGLTGTNAVTSNGLVTGARAANFETRSGGFTGGGQIGYNYQLGGAGLPGFGGVGPNGGVVIGVEADAVYTDLRGAGAYTGYNGDVSLYRSRTDFVGTVRGRVGYAFGTVLVYGTGGFAYGGVNASANFLTPAGVTNRAGSGSSLQTGYAYGGGVEFALPTATVLNPFHAGAVTLKGEFIHYDLGNQSIAIQYPLPAAYEARVHTSGNLVRVGINYKFGSVAAPVVARY